MERLIEMRSVPIELEFRRQDARFEMKSQPPSVEITRNKGGLNISSKSVRVKLDSYDARSSMGFKTASDSVREYAERGVQAAYDATASFAEEGNMLMEIQNGDQAFSEIAFQRSQDTLDTTIGFTPSVPVKIDWDPAELSMQYEMDRLQFDWRTNHQVSEWEFIPGKLEFAVKQYPQMEFTYIGSPIYVPPSSSPDYQPTFNTTA